MTKSQANRYAVRMYREGRMPAIRREMSAVRMGKYIYYVSYNQES